MNYTKIPMKNGVTAWMQGKWTKAEIKAYASGKVPKRVKVPINSDLFYSTSKFLKVIGYRLDDVLRATPRSKIFAIYKLVD
jgi:hypothetical protein